MVTSSIGVSASVVTIKENLNVDVLEEECNGDPGFGIHNIPYEKQLQEFLENPTLDDEQKEAAIIAINEAIMLRDNEQVSAPYAANATYSEKTIPVTAYTQEESFYCGPATARQTLKYLGSIVPGGYNPPSQSIIAADIHTSKSGTEWKYLINYINGFNFMNTPHTYIEHTPQSVGNMETIIYNSLTQSRPEPPILHINTGGNTSALGYSTTGHYLNVSGIRTSNGNNQFRLTDPNRQRLSEPLPATYWVSTLVIYNFTRNHWAGHFMC